MNNLRRMQISDIASRLATLKDELETIQQEEQDSFDNMPEGLQQSDRGQAAEEAANNLQSAIDDMDNAMSYLDEAQS